MDTLWPFCFSYPLDLGQLSVCYAGSLRGFFFQRERKSEEGGMFAISFSLFILILLPSLVLSLFK